MNNYKQGDKEEFVNKDVVVYLKKILTEIDEEDEKVLPKWRVKCIQLLNQKIRDVLVDYHTKRFAPNKDCLEYHKGQN
jgi:hypothetical protein